MGKELEYSRKKSSARIYFVKILLAVLGFYMTAAVMCGCRFTKIDYKKIQDVPYEIIDEDSLPDTISDYVCKVYGSVCRQIYMYSGDIYIIICYGEQPTSGYTIKVDALYESRTSIIVETTLIGPREMDKVKKQISKPYIVLKINKTDKEVIFK